MYRSCPPHHHHDSTMDAIPSLPPAAPPTLTQPPPSHTQQPQRSPRAHPPAFKTHHHKHQPQTGGGSKGKKGSIQIHKQAGPVPRPSAVLNKRDTPTNDDGSSSSPRPHPSIDQLLPSVSCSLSYPWEMLMAWSTAAVAKRRKNIPRKNYREEREKREMPISLDQEKT